MPRRKAEIGQRWWIKELGTWRVIHAIHHHHKQGRLYGVRDGECPEYSLGPVSATRMRGRFFRSRSLVRRYTRQWPREVDTKRQSPPQNGREPQIGAKGDSSPALALSASQGKR